MPISLTLTPFDHFQNMSSGGIGPDLILTLCHKYIEDKDVEGGGNDLKKEQKGWIDKLRCLVAAKFFSTQKCIFVQRENIF